MNTKTKSTTALSVLLLLALAAVLPACDILNPFPCDPAKEICPITTHPNTLDPG